MVRKIIRAGIEGQCAGILWALKGMEYLVTNIRHQSPKAQIFAYPIGHNEEIVDLMKSLRIGLVNNINEVPAGGIYLISAHGCSKEERQKAEKRGVIVADLTCPLVARNHKLIHHSLDKEDASIVIIGHRNHQEVKGYLGPLKNPRVFCVEIEEEVANIKLFPGTQEIIIILQTTLSQRDVAPISKAIKKRFSNLRISDYQGRCYATINRQNALIKMIRGHNVDVVVLVGDIRRSSNTQRLFEIAQYDGIRVMPVLNESELRKDDLEAFQVIGITAGASTIPATVDKVVNRLEQWFGVRAITDRFFVEKEFFPESLFMIELEKIYKKITR